MYFFATFEYSNTLELALSELERNDIDKSKILVLPLDKRVGKTVLFDTLHQSDGKSLFDLTTSFGVVFMLLGGIYGFVLDWGPIIWALFGLIFGGVFGTLLGILFKKKHDRVINTNSKYGEVIVMVNCEDSNRKIVEEIFWDHYAIGVALHDINQLPRKAEI